MLEKNVETYSSEKLYQQARWALHNFEEIVEFTNDFTLLKDNVMSVFNKFLSDLNKPENYIPYTQFVIATNHQLWDVYHEYEKHKEKDADAANYYLELTKIYDELWRFGHDKAHELITDDEAFRYYFEQTD